MNRDPNHDREAFVTLLIAGCLVVLVLMVAFLLERLG